MKIRKLSRLSKKRYTKANDGWHNPRMVYSKKHRDIIKEEADYLSDIRNKGGA